MTFQHCGIVGLGLLGGSLACDFRRHFPDMRITGIARRQQTLQLAGEMHHGGTTIFDELSADFTALRTADLVLLCTPVQTIISHLAQLAPVLTPGTVLSDVGSTKRAIMNAASTLYAAETVFIGGHPMAGSDRMGLENARIDLFREATWALCVPPGGESAATRLQQLLSAIGAHPLVIDAAQHDDLVALTSHLPHVLAAALTNQVLGHAYGDAVLPFLAGGFRDSTRIAASHPEMWRDIMLTNRDRITAALNALIDELQQWRDAIRTGDAPHVEALLTQAQRRREQLNK